MTMETTDEKNAAAIANALAQLGSLTDEEADDLSERTAKFRDNWREEQPIP